MNDLYRGLHPAVEVRSSPVHGLGVFAQAPIAAGARIGTYRGRRYTAEQSERRDWSQQLTYVFGLPDGSVIDGARGGNATRHLNHSCEPNCAAFIVERGPGRYSVQLEARRDIAPGEELFLDYQLQVEDGTEQDYRCQCGAASCRGTMVATGGSR
jgi:hypothetical protein